MLKKILLTAVLASLLEPALANAGTIAIRGAGTASCGTWVKELELRHSLFQWVVGFVTATNYAESQKAPDRPGETDVLDGADHNAIDVWMTNYCTENPLTPLWIAAGVLAKEGSIN